MSNILLILTLVVGLLLIALEIVALPGGVAGLFGTLLTVVGIWLSYRQLGLKGGTIVLICCAIIIALLLILFLKTKTWKRFSLNEESDSTTNQITDPAIAVGTRGTTVARLAPTGKALLDGQLMEVHAINKFIDPDRPIEVVAIEGYRIDVRELEDDRFSTQEK